MNFLGNFLRSRLGCTSQQLCYNSIFVFALCPILSYLQPYALSYALCPVLLDSPMTHTLVVLFVSGPLALVLGFTYSYLSACTFFSFPLSNYYLSCKYCAINWTISIDHCISSSTLRIKESSGKESTNRRALIKEIKVPHLYQRR